MSCDDPSWAETAEQRVLERRGACCIISDACTRKFLIDWLMLTGWQVDEYLAILLRRPSRMDVHMLLAAYHDQKLNETESYVSFMAGFLRAWGHSSNVDDSEGSGLNVLVTEIGLMKSSLIQTRELDGI